MKAPQQTLRHTRPPLRNHNTIESFRSAMIQAGLEPPSYIEADGRLHRFHNEGDKRSTKNAWYVLHIDGGIPAGMFGNWKIGITHHWSAKERHQMTRQELDAHCLRMEQARRQRVELDRRNHDMAATKANEIWHRAAPADGNHAYLVRKSAYSGERDR
jgi:putative DNA primase/helicase